jgi:cytosine/adenosine deaminase-related metal-dependent hydrolase
LGIAELLSSGTATVLSMESVNHTDESFQAAEDLGIRAFIGKALMDRREPGTEMLGESTDDALADLVRLTERWHGAAGGRLRVVVSPRGPRNATPELWRAGIDLAAERDLRLHTHVAENRAHADRLGATPEGRDVVALARWGALGPRLVMAHSVWLDDQERDLVRLHRPHVCHCPSANLKLASGIAPVPAYLDDGINVALGADGAACNNRLDGFHEMRLAALIHKPRYGPRAMAAETVLGMATLGGARALGIEAETGSIEVGKRADLALVRRGGFGSTPMAGWGAAEQLVYSHTSADVETTLVDGQVLWHQGQLTRADARQIVAEAETARLAVMGRAQIEPPVANP